jgi:hypothetical protein
MDNVWLLVEEMNDWDIYIHAFSTEADAKQAMKKLKDYYEDNNWTIDDEWSAHFRVVDRAWVFYEEYPIMKSFLDFNP